MFSWIVVIFSRISARVPMDDLWSNPQTSISSIGAFDEVIRPIHQVRGSLIEPPTSPRETPLQ